ncbi:MAG: phosphoribosylformylglycinamidine cyclo-ligase [Dehalococcoidia bacterium]
MAANNAPRTYRDAGVDLDAAAAVKERIKDLAAGTLGPGVVGGPGFFGGIFDPDPAGQMLLVSSTDSVGTKLRVAEAMGRHDTIGIDIVNHCVNDVLPAGATPLFFLDYIGISRFDQERIAQIVTGLSRACSEAGCALLGGETATLPGIYHGDDYDLVGFIVGSVQKDALLGPENTRPGDILLGLPSSGLHTNGYSLVRSIFGIDDNPSLVDQPVPGTDRTLGDALLEPHRSYLPALRPVLNRIRGMGHITGGGFFKNVPRSLADGLGAEIDISTWETPPLFRFIQERGNVDEAEMYRVYNMGVGMVVIVEPAFADEVMSEVPGSWRIGRVVEKSGAERVTLVGG